jgi:hypothetical protein
MLLNTGKNGDVKEGKDKRTFVQSMHRSYVSWLHNKMRFLLIGRAEIAESSVDTISARTFSANIYSLRNSLVQRFFSGIFLRPSADLSYWFPFWCLSVCE